MQGVDYEVEIAEVEGRIAKVNVNGIPFEIEMQKPINAAKHPALAAAKPKVEPVAEVSQQPAANPQPVAAAPQPAAASAQPVAGGNAVKAPLPGTITDIKVSVGQQVNAGDIVIVLEAMKMQNNIEAESAGTIKAINVNRGDSVMEGAVLLTIG